MDDDSIDVTINVTDVNEAPEFDSTAPTALDIVENTIADTDIDSPVTATDPDNTTANPTKDTLTYSLDTGDGASFEIDSSGQIKTKEPLDRETKPATQLPSRSPTTRTPPELPTLPSTTPTQ